MRSLLALVMAVFLVAILPHTYADQNQEKVLSENDQCVVKYLGCRDNCDYYDNEANIKPCQKSCDQQYSCRPKKGSIAHNHQNPLMD